MLGGSVYASGDDRQQLATPLTGLRLLDVGVGGGILTLALCRLGADVVGLDASEAAVKTARCFAEVAFVGRREALERVRFEAESIERYAERNQNG